MPCITVAHVLWLMVGVQLKIAHLKAQLEECTSEFSSPCGSQHAKPPAGDRRTGGVEVVRLGLLLAMTGWSAGKYIMGAATLAIADINANPSLMKGRRLEYIWADAGSIFSLHVPDQSSPIHMQAHDPGTMCHAPYCTRHDIAIDVYSIKLPSIPLFSPSARLVEINPVHSFCRLQLDQRRDGHPRAAQRRRADSWCDWCRLLERMRANSIPHRRAGPHAGCVCFSTHVCALSTHSPHMSTNMPTNMSAHMSIHMSIPMSPCMCICT